MRPHLLLWPLTCVVASSFLSAGSGAFTSAALGLYTGPSSVQQVRWRRKRSETEDASLDERRRSIIAALDDYFGFKSSNARIVRGMMTGGMDSEQEKYSKKKDLIHGTTNVGKEAGSTMKGEGSENTPIIVLTEESNLEITMDEKKMQKMKAMVDHMLTDMSSSNFMMNFQRAKVPSGMSGHISDIMHGFKHPMLRDFKEVQPPVIGKENLKLLKESLSTFSPHHLGAEFATSNVASEARKNLGDVESRGLAKSTENHEQSLSAKPHFTTLEVALGPAIVPLHPPEGYFVPFIPRKAFGVTNGVSRPPHGHASFYLHRPPGLVDVPNSPAFGFFFSGHIRSPDIEETNHIVPDSSNPPGSFSALSSTDEIHVLSAAMQETQSYTINFIEALLLPSTSSCRSVAVVSSWTGMVDWSVVTSLKMLALTPFLMTTAIAILSWDGVRYNCPGCARC
ncbi:hypothetical protein FHG87_006266 [Trinorchestia longiramus]|nr:hypothetical protein FHG87_006266 [Trinorchestia longiramus]